MYNKGELVGRSIRSILGQTYSDFEIIVVDDGSTDNGIEIVRGFKDDRIKLISQENAGPGAARNAGIKAANTEYIAFLDADDEWYPWFLENSLKAIEEYDVPLVASMYYRFPDGTDMTTLAAKNGVHPGRYELTGSEDPAWASAAISMLHPLNILMNTETARKYDGFYDKDECTYGEDQMLFLRIAVSEEFAIITPSASRYHCEDSQHGLPEKHCQLEPYLADPNAILSYCREEKKHLMQGILEIRAIHTACHMLKRGERQAAAKLIKRFPDACRHKKMYHKLMRKFGLGTFYPFYIAVKRSTITPVKKMLRSVTSTKKDRPPPMPYEQDAHDSQ